MNWSKSALNFGFVNSAIRYAKLFLYAEPVLSENPHIVTLKKLLTTRLPVIFVERVGQTPSP